jgi:hypothetical protein
MPMAPWLCSPLSLGLMLYNILFSGFPSARQPDGKRFKQAGNAS